MNNNDSIEKHVLLRATRNRVWRALSDSTEFGTWFGVKFDGPFQEGSTLHGVIVPTGVNAEVAQAQKKYEGTPFEITVEQLKPERLFSFRWHPYAVEPGVDYSSEPTTLVVFTLEDDGSGVKLTVTESGFDRIPLARRARAFAANEQGWGMVVNLIKEHLAQNAVEQGPRRRRPDRPRSLPPSETRRASGWFFVSAMMAQRRSAG